MQLFNTARLGTFARLIALGYPPMLAAKGAGYRNLRASRAATRLVQPPAAAPPEPPRAAAAKATKSAGAAQAARPPLPPMLTEEEWWAEFGYLARREAARTSLPGAQPAV
jgi:hypothetical protein